ncbi:NB-ARC domain, LRR domain containing protein [Parasponia andersonii]|uniref:NB-ARC domain, LRR domain containing protein n=1 Tax=Parasponia andersonii TaxID=3476 RepID=A0A2P5AX26_PARAD|nr:NB-ARC domain, LRR domain containing protein [Parasponia andersonii]
MAETVLSMLTEAIVSAAIHRISDLLINEATPLTSVRGDVEYLRNELRRMQGFLKRACSKHEHDDQVRIWLGEIREVASDIEDVVETYVVKFDSSYVKALHLRSLRKPIGDIKIRIQGIFESKEMYEIQLGSSEIGEATTSAAEQERISRKSYPVCDDEEENHDLISLDQTVTILKTKLTGERDDRLRVVPIVGMGGLGKTALAKKVYNDNDVKHHFDRCAWVFISQKYVLREVLSEILIQVGFSQSRHIRNDSEDLLEERKRKREILNTLDEGDLIVSIKDELKEKLYLVVLDDIWRIDDWDSLRRAFPRGVRGSKIVFTTRSKQVASYANPHDCAIEPPLLTPEGSWELLQRKAMPRDIFGNYHSSQFEHMGKEMVNKCGGLPFAIVVLGGLLRTKRSYDEWQKVVRDVNSYLNKHNHRVEDMLALSYHDLPYYLKPCFLYLGNFPDDSEIPKKELIQLWIAEGFITEPTSRRQTMEEIAEDYLEELIDRCMIQIVKRDYTGVGVKTCRLHHLMRDFCVSKARADNFFEVIQPQEENITAASSSSSTYQTRSRRIAVHPGYSLDRRQMHPHLRSLIYFDVSPPSISDIIRGRNSKLLRVLELRFSRGTRKCKVPSEIGDLIHLRYLGLRNVGRVKLPCSIGNLRSLGTINLRDNDEVVLPAEILRLARLKHLLLPFNTDFPHSFRWPTYILSTPTQIQTLKYIRFGPLLLRNKITQVELRNLQNLGVQFTSHEDVRFFLLSTPNFRFSMLQSLHMSLLSASVFPNLQPLSECVILSKLFLDGKISDGHNLEFLPPSLTKLTLRDSDLSTDPMPILENLPSLRFIRLHNSYNGSEMVCGAQGFPRLETLQLFSLRNVTKWRVELGTAMPNLKRLCIKNMPELRIIPEELRYITTLKELMICDMLLYSQVLSWESHVTDVESALSARREVREWRKLAFSIGVLFLVYSLYYSCSVRFMS